MEIKITKSSRVCAQCERPFEHKEEIFSLVTVEEHSLVRRDFDLEHWDPEQARGTIAAWSTTYIDPKVEAQQPPEVFSPLRQVFYESAESEDREDIAKAYLAAQLLRRQKVFRLIKEFEGEEGEVRIALFADRIGDRLIEVGDPNLSYPELEAGRKALLTRLAQLESQEEETEETTATREQDDAQTQKN